jgi:hypothetical protein
MTAVLYVLPLATTLALYAAYIKLSARLLRCKVSWKYGFLFVLLLIFVAFVGQTVSFMSGWSLPPATAMVFGITMQTLLGGWFFSKRATDDNGRLLGWTRAIYLSLLTALFMAATIAVPFGAIYLFSPASS